MSILTGSGRPFYSSRVFSLNLPPSCGVKTAFISYICIYLLIFEEVFQQESIDFKDLRSKFFEILPSQVSPNSGLYKATIGISDCGTSENRLKIDLKFKYGVLASKYNSRVYVRLKIAGIRISLHAGLVINL